MIKKKLALLSTVLVALPATTSVVSCQSFNIPIDIDILPDLEKFDNVDTKTIIDEINYYSKINRVNAEQYSGLNKFFNDGDDGFIKDNNIDEIILNEIIYNKWKFDYRLVFVLNSRVKWNKKLVDHFNQRKLNYYEKLISNEKLITAINNKNLVNFKALILLIQKLIEVKEGQDEKG